MITLSLTITWEASSIGTLAFPPPPLNHCKAHTKQISLKSDRFQQCEFPNSVDSQLNTEIFNYNDMNQANQLTYTITWFTVGWILGVIKNYKKKSIEI